MINQTNRSGAANSAGLALVALGVFFLIAQFLDVTVWGFAWPFMIIIPGLLFFVVMFAGGPKASALAIPGSIITTVGLILLYQSTFDHFESWAYAWALIPTAAGGGLMLGGSRAGDVKRVTAGQRMVRLGLGMFAIGFTFFELLLNISGFFSGWAGHSIGPLILIAAGVYLFVKRSVSRAFGGGAAAQTSADERLDAAQEPQAPVAYAGERIEDPARTNEPALR